MIIGVGQVLAILWPGSSRSGSCLMLARFLGIERLTALRFTFLLSIPSVLGAAVLMLKDLTISTVDWGQLLWGIMIAAAVGTCTIHSLERLWSYQALLIISIYRILLGIGILVFMR
jgi:undecaprenyl-diphosphatase